MGRLLQYGSSRQECSPFDELRASGYFPLVVSLSNHRVSFGIGSRYTDIKVKG